jgi:uncharacterized protein DUF397
MSGAPLSVWDNSCRTGPAESAREEQLHGGGGSNCVEAAEARHAIAVLDSTDALGPILFFKQHAWRQFAARVKTQRLQ